MGFTGDQTVIMANQEKASFRSSPRRAYQGIWGLFGNLVTKLPLRKTLSDQFSLREVIQNLFFVGSPMAVDQLKVNY